MSRPTIPVFVDYDDAGRIISGRTDDVASIRIDAPAACHALHDDALAARLPWRLVDRRAPGRGVA